MSKKRTNKLATFNIFPIPGEWHLNGSYAKMRQLKDIMAKLIQSHLKFMLGGMAGGGGFYIGELQWKSPRLHEQS